MNLHINQLKQEQIQPLTLYKLLYAVNKFIKGLVLLVKIHRESAS